MEVLEIPEAFVNFCLGTGAYQTPCVDTLSDCVQDIGSCYPLSDMNDLHFQVLLSVGSSDDNLDGIVSGTIKFYIGYTTDCDNCNPSGVKMTQLHVEQWKTTGADQYDYFVLNTDTWTNTSQVDALSTGECFKLCLIVQGMVSAPAEYTNLGCSPCFIKVTDVCDTSVIKYRLNETSMGFYNNGNTYYNTYFNTIRLPLKLSKPQIKNKKKTYALSNGNFKTASATLSREWIATTDFISEVWHKKLAIALNQDTLKITNTNSGFSDSFFVVQGDDNYKVSWEDMVWDYPNAPAEFILTEMPFAEYNQNCNLTPLSPLVDVNAILTDAYNILIWS